MCLVTLIALNFCESLGVLFLVKLLFRKDI